ncbi:MAG: hypothetical protein HUK15_03920 [Bacteroidales bacterium]|nr:hypothetical protein [Bacteroidales bacterium]
MSYPTVVFNSSISRGGSILRPDRIIIDSEFVTYEKRNSNFINCDSITIPLRNVSAVKLDVHLIGTTITITSFGGEKIVGERFSKSDAVQIRDTIFSRR